MVKAKLPDDDNFDPPPLTDDEIAKLKMWAEIEPDVAKFASDAVLEAKASLIKARAKSKKAHKHYGNVLRRLRMAIEGRAKFNGPMKKIGTLRDQSIRVLDEFDRELSNLLRDFK